MKRRPPIPTDAVIAAIAAIKAWRENGDFRAAYDGANGMNPLKDEIVVNEGDIVQIRPDYEINTAFAGCLVIVSAVMSWGVQGYVLNAGVIASDQGVVTINQREAWIRLAWDQIEPTGGRVVFGADVD